MKNVSRSIAQVSALVVLSSSIFMAFAATASADVIRCAFTEPFISTEYSMAQQTLTIVDNVTSPAKKSVLKNISFQIKSAADFELVNAKGEVIQSLKLNRQGSDGMSETVYPYEVQFNGARGNNIGGCESNFLKSTTAK